MSVAEIGPRFSALHIETADPLTTETLFNEIVERFYPVFLSLARRATGSPEKAEDIVQETFLKVWRNMGNYKSAGSFEAWLNKILENTTLDELRKQSRHPEVVIDSNAFQDPDSVLTEQESRWREPSEVVVAKDSYEELTELLSNITPDHLYVLQLWADGYSIRDIEEVLGIPRGSVGSRIHRARNAARLALANQRA